jgi:hypothetical protein
MNQVHAASRLRYIKNASRAPLQNRAVSVIPEFLRIKCPDFSLFLPARDSLN